MKPLAIDLYAGLGGWAEGLLAHGWRVIGFDVERHDYGKGSYPGELVLQDVRTIHGAQFRNADLIVASPPCQFFSRMAMPFKMPWTQEEFERRRNLGLELFWQCFRIQHEASEAAGHKIPMVVENVKGAQKWVGDARWHFGSFYLWGDTPALMPQTKQLKVGRNFHQYAKTGIPSASFHGAPHEASVRRANAIKNSACSWFAIGSPGQTELSRNPVNGLKFGGGWWNDATNNLIRKASSRSQARKAASAMIAKIPEPLSSWIARVYHPAL